MMNKKYIIQKNDSAIRTGEGIIRDELSLFNKWILWFNSLSYVQRIEDIETAKQFLSGTHDFHENQVITFLKSKSGGELPPNLNPLRQTWDIQDCEQKDFSGCASWPHLAMNKGMLIVPESVFIEIEEKHTIRARTNQEKQLIDRIARFELDLDYFLPENKTTILVKSGLYNLTSKNLQLNTDFFYKLLKQ